MGEKEQFFVLDIGTRSVIGLIIHYTEGKYHCIDYYVKEHDDRAMMDGQIHHIQSVSETVICMKQYFERTHGRLQKVYIAAAGRSLRTERILVNQDIKNSPPLTEEAIQHLEWRALQEAQSILSNQPQSTGIQSDYAFIGYTPLFYFIDQQPIGSLLHQQGDLASMEIIATFLPKLVITSLEATLQRAKLEIAGLTLEPIACVQTLIPPSLRHLNIALIDIGAGTSDIAITDEGTIVAYGMVPQAGDEVTEVIQQLTLTDFHEAERIKHQLIEQKSFTIETLLNSQQLISSEDLLELLSPHIEMLAESLSLKVKQLNNNKSPMALLLIGGGSLTPYLHEKLGVKLQLSPQQVMIKGLTDLKQFSFPKELAHHPMYVTPFSIAFAANESPLKFVSITINGKTERLMKLSKLTVQDALLSAGYLTRNWYGDRGHPKVITLNQQKMMIPGSNGKPPYIYLNGSKAKLNDVIHADDQIDIVRGMAGEPAEIRVSDCIEGTEEKSIYIHDAKYSIMPMIKVNQITTSTQYLLENGDQIDYQIPTTISDIFTALDLAHLLEEVKPFYLVINGKYTMVPSHSGKIVCNGNAIYLDSHINHLDRLEVIEQTPLTIADLKKYKSYSDKASISVTVNKKVVQPYKELLKFKRGEEILNEECHIYSGDVLEIIEQGNVKFYFHDVLKFAHIKIPFQEAVHYSLFKNGEQSSLTDEILHGDKLEIRWSSKNFKQEKQKKLIQSDEKTSSFVQLK